MHYLYIGKKIRNNMYKEQKNQIKFSSSVQSFKIGMDESILM